MYLDTDVVLALVKKDDWLKPHINVRKINNPKTSVFTIIESKIILLREYNREEIFSIINKIKAENIDIIPINEKILEKSLEMLKKYKKLNIFDSIHVACSLIKNETIISTDHIFDEIGEIKKIDPRRI